MKKKNKLSYILEITWAVVTIVILGISIHGTITQGFKESIGLYFLTLLSLVMYFLRRYRRIQ